MDYTDLSLTDGFLDDVDITLADWDWNMSPAEPLIEYHRPPHVPSGHLTVETRNGLWLSDNADSVAQAGTQFHGGRPSDDLQDLNDPLASIPTPLEANNVSDAQGRLPFLDPSIALVSAEDHASRAQIRARSHPDELRGAATARAQYPCPHPGCTYHCTTLNGLRHHRRYHIPRENRRHACHHCPARFHFPRELRRHLPTHGPQYAVERIVCPFPECPNARLGFARRDHLLRHMRSRHSESASSAGRSTRSSAHYSRT